ncbi:MAG: Hsp20/alpha crystallin family protein [Spirochaetaceae bacterium]|nr:Hsp20/alpha crystallin family protein [Spirochaetaceae bacterium]
MRYLVNRPVNIFGDFDRVLNNIFDEKQVLNSKSPAVDISENKKAYILEFDLPGFSEKDVEVNVEDNKLKISSVNTEAEDKDIEKNDEIQYLVKERNHSVFSRNFILPKDADREAISGSFKNGVLTVTIAKSPAEQARSIKIKAA